MDGGLSDLDANLDGDFLEWVQEHGELFRDEDTKSEEDRMQSAAAFPSLAAGLEQWAQDVEDFSGLKDTFTQQHRSVGTMPTGHHPRSLKRASSSTSDRASNASGTEQKRPARASKHRATAKGKYKRNLQREDDVDDSFDGETQRQRRKRGPEKTSKFQQIPNSLAPTSRRSSSSNSNSQSVSSTSNFAAYSTSDSSQHAERDKAGKRVSVNSSSGQTTGFSNACVPPSYSKTSRASEANATAYEDQLSAEGPYTFSKSGFTSGTTAESASGASAFDNGYHSTLKSRPRQQWSEDQGGAHGSYSSQSRSQSSKQTQHRGYPARASERATLLERIKMLQAEKEVLLAKFEATPTRCTSSQDALDALRELGAQRTQRSDIDAYMSRFMQLGSSWDGTLSQMSALEKNLEPSAILKMFLWALLQNESFFAPSPSRSRSASRRGAARTDRDSEGTEQAAPEEGMPWQMLCNALEMDLSRKGAKFHEMRRKAKSLASQLWLAKSRLRMLHETIVTSRDGVDRKCSSLLESLPEKDCIMLLERVEAGTGRPLDSQAPSNFFSSISPWNSES